MLVGRGRGGLHGDGEDQGMAGPGNRRTEGWARQRDGDRGRDDRGIGKPEEQD